MQCLILAGGLGTRMSSQTQVVPKALIPVHGRPFAHHQMDLLVREGVSSVVFSIGYKGDMIRESLRSGEEWKVPIHYVDEGTNLLGTGGALRKAVDSQLLEETFLVLNGDSYLPVQIKPVWEAYFASKRPVLMTLLKNQGKWDTSNIRYQNGQILYQKNAGELLRKDMDYIDFGLSVMNRATIREEIPSGVKFDLADFLFKASLEGKIFGYEVFQRFYEIGSPQGLEDFKRFIASSVLEKGSDE